MGKYKFILYLYKFNWKKLVTLQVYKAFFCKETDYLQQL